MTKVILTLALAMSAQAFATVGHNGNTLRGKGSSSANCSNYEKGQVRMAKEKSDRKLPACYETGAFTGTGSSFADCTPYERNLVRQAHEKSDRPMPACYKPGFIAGGVYVDRYAGMSKWEKRRAQARDRN